MQARHGNNDDDDDSTTEFIFEYLSRLLPFYNNSTDFSPHHHMDLFRGSREKG